MSDLSQIALVREMLDSAERSVRSARKILAELTGETLSNIKIDEKHFQHIDKPTASSEGKVLYGIFDGKNMLDEEQKTYPIPANYASKSKLVYGDKLKLTITPEGKFIYKSIGPVPRKTVRGTLTYEDGQYKVLSSGSAYKVLLASVTFNRADVGDEIALLLPEEGESEWGTVDAVIPDETKE